MHKLVFEEDVLPDGTEVAYYSRGQVVVIKVVKNFFVLINWMSFLISNMLCAEIVGWLQKRIWNLLHLL